MKTQSLYLGQWMIPV